MASLARFLNMEEFADPNTVQSRMDYTPLFNNPSTASHNEIFSFPSEIRLGGHLTNSSHSANPQAWRQEFAMFDAKYRDANGSPHLSCNQVSTPNLPLRPTMSHPTMGFASTSSPFTQSGLQASASTKGFTSMLLPDFSIQDCSLPTPYYWNGPPADIADRGPNNSCIEGVFRTAEPIATPTCISPDPPRFSFQASTNAHVYTLPARLECEASPYLLQLSPTSLPSANGLSQHHNSARNTCQERKTYCAICDLHFGRIYDWRRHNDSVHAKKYPYNCSMCGQRFKRADACKRHSSTKKDRGRSCCPRRTLIFTMMKQPNGAQRLLSIMKGNGLKCINASSCKCAAEFPLK